MNVLYVAEPEKRDPAMRTHFFHLKVLSVSTASRGKGGEPEVTKEKGLHMIEKALERTDLPGEVRRILIGWLTDNSDNSEVSESFLMRVSVKERREKHEPPLGLHINIVKVSHLGSAILEVAADR